jgi:hypothetical protein
MAEGGAALLLQGSAAEPPPEEHLPDGFAWIVARADEAGALPGDHFRLIVDPRGGPEAGRGLGPLLLRGGVLVSRGVPRPDGASGLRTISIDETHDPPFVIARRED